MENQNLSELFPVEYSGTAKLTGICKSRTTETNSVISFRDIDTKRLVKVTVTDTNPALKEAQDLLGKICDVSIFPFTTEEGYTVGTISSGCISDAITAAETAKFKMPLSI